MHARCNKQGQNTSESNFLTRICKRARLASSGVQARKYPCHNYGMKKSRTASALVQNAPQKTIITDYGVCGSIFKLCKASLTLNLPVYCLQDDMQLASIFKIHTLNLTGRFFKMDHAQNIWCQIRRGDRFWFLESG